MHWSKTRHVSYEACPRQFFYETVAAPLNPKIDALRKRVSGPLVRHEAVRTAVTKILSTQNWNLAELPVVLAEARAAMLMALGNGFEVNSEMSIVEACVRNFVVDVLPVARAQGVLYVHGEEPVEFIYDELPIMALPELVLDCGDRVEIYQFRTGSSSFAARKDSELRLKAGGLTCWARCSLGELTRPVHIVDAYLKTRPVQRREVTLSDPQVRDFVAAAKSILPKYSMSARIADFEARPDVGTCRFCAFKTICPEYGTYAEMDYSLDGLVLSLNEVAEARVVAREQTGGELRTLFLCHVSEDKIDYVRPFARALEVAGVSYWLDEAELMWGDSLVKGINQGLATSEFVMPFISQGFLDRGWTQAELAAGVNAMIKGQKRVMPVMIADREAFNRAYPLLADVVSRNWTDGIPALIAELQRVLARAGVAG
jgi:hypothetical protein